MEHYAHKTQCHLRLKKGGKNNQLIQIPSLPLQEMMSCAGHTTAQWSHRFESSPLLIGKYQIPGPRAPLRNCLLVRRRLPFLTGRQSRQGVCLRIETPLPAESQLQSQVPCIGFKPLKKKIIHRTFYKNASVMWFSSKLFFRREEKSKLDFHKRSAWKMNFSKGGENGIEYPHRKNVLI